MLQKRSLIQNLIRSLVPYSLGLHFLILILVPWYLTRNPQSQIRYLVPYQLDFPHLIQIPYHLILTHNLPYHLILTHNQIPYHLILTHRLPYHLILTHHLAPYLQVPLHHPCQQRTLTGSTWSLQSSTSAHHRSPPAHTHNHCCTALVVYPTTSSQH